uniref:Uncharacterized protein n=1 Tax=Chromera velia CCMP2878 TaxID=1169474 RepID=A0A0G4GEA2_9ALVE|mmetsp:Transcript_17208/g.34895  ORF Transcript_17208/g.34895 Transcript_17208/m.34895 type:complete len:251 (-) Transcript_17208:189-941(-)|eukprot:Cvel_21403.t1-p1 / transcript=Cvel_21403.t1 / gene=Cvel_21403 / organism=Chromera_velia_CCMP2878 / gene_product=hypothetical protein / transcript_product=hypothetical protein / location=Cvel_scaffold2004:31130-34067(+) / protein_length=250 / sequence_SO=supercontig / SO=protein_coding / is_pseudo=false
MVQKRKPTQVQKEDPKQRGKGKEKENRCPQQSTAAPPALLSPAGSEEKERVKLQEARKRLKKKWDEMKVSDISLRLGPGSSFSSGDPAKTVDEMCQKPFNSVDPDTDEKGIKLLEGLKGEEGAWAPTLTCGDAVLWRAWIKPGGRAVLTRNYTGDTHVMVGGVGDLRLGLFKFENADPPLEFSAEENCEILVPKGARCLVFNPSSEGVLALRGISVTPSQSPKGKAAGGGPVEKNGLGGSGGALKGASRS